MKEKLKVILVDDYKIFRACMRTFLEEVLNYNVVGESSNGLEFLNSFSNNADIVLMDIEMLEMNGIEATKQAIISYPNSKIIAVSYSKDLHDTMLLKQAGFKACINKQNIYNTLPLAISKVLNNETYC